MSSLPFPFPTFSYFSAVPPFTTSFLSLSLSDELSQHHTRLNNHPPRVLHSIFLVNTDRDLVDKEGISFVEKLERAVAASNDDTGRCNAQVLHPPFSPSPKSYGYDVTDWALQLLVESGGCTYFMFSNADNYYLPTLLSELVVKMDEGRDFIAFDFLTHHPRTLTNVVNVQIKRKFIDLGAFVTSYSAVNDSGAKFMPAGRYTKDMFARDWHFVEKVADHAKTVGGQDNVCLIRKVLLSHN